MSMINIYLGSVLNTFVDLPYGGPSTPTNVSGPWCHVCEKDFASEALMTAHYLRCKVNSERATEKVAQVQPSGLPDITKTLTAAPKKPSTGAARLQHPNLGGSVLDRLPRAPEVASGTPSRSNASNRSSQSSRVPCGHRGCNKSFKSIEGAEQHREATHGGPAKPSNFRCGVVHGCDKTFKSQNGLMTHKNALHGASGKKPDLHENNVCHLSQASRTQSRAAGTPLPGPPPKNSQHLPAIGGRGPIPITMREPARQTPAFVPQPSRNRLPTQVPVNQIAQRDHVLSGQADIDQAIQLQDNTMRLLITAEIAISHEGKIHYDGIAYQRIGVGRQGDAASMLNELVHLPKKLQAKYHTPHSKTFAADFKHAHYPVMEHVHLPEPKEDTPRRKVVVISCGKVLLANGCEEIVKIAAIDVLTGQILMDYFVCTDPKLEVKDWRPATTGLTCFKDFETYRLQKYKVLKGWKSARAALSKYADGNTILVGHNLRVDQDALGIVHGRGIDLVILMEKAANGPLSKAQVRLESLMRDLPQVMLKPGTRHGRDTLQDAFAIRELVLWYVKNKDKAVSYMKKKSLEYQRVL